MPKPKRGESKNDFVSRCMGDGEAKRDFPNRDQRLAFCHSVYERHRAENMELATAVVRLGGGIKTRIEQLQGRDHLVVPAVLVQAQVLHNNLGSTFLPPDEITDEWAEEWNGVPVIIHDHPSRRGIPISARTPEIWNSRGVGYVFSAHVARNGTTQLKAEVWLDMARAEQLGELQTIVSRLHAGEPVELSTGFLSMTEEVSGVNNGESYEKILRPRGADHLAIFVDKTGACSLEDGCGLGVQEFIPTPVVNVRSSARRPKYSSTIDKRWKKPTLADFEGSDVTWDDLSAARKRAIVEITLLGEVEDTFAASMVFPVVSADGALNRNALNAVRSIAHGGRGGADIPKAAADSAYAMAGKLLKEEFDVEVSDNVATATNNGPYERGRVLALMDRLLGLLGTGTSGEGGADDSHNAKGTGAEFRMILRRLKALGLTNLEIADAIERSASTVVQAERGEILNPSAETLEKLRAFAKQRFSKNQSSDGRSDEERRLLLADALEAQFGGSGKMVWIDAVYSEKNQVVFGVSSEQLGAGMKQQLYQADYSFSTENVHEVTFTEPVTVDRRVVYERTGNTTEVKQMNDPEKKVEGTTTTGDQATQAAANAAAANAAAATKEPEKKETPAAATNTQSQEPEKKEPEKKVEQATATVDQSKEIAQLKEELATLRKVTEPIVAEKERERQKLVDELAANERVPFDKAELEAKPVEELRKLRAMSRGENYAARGGPRVADNAAEKEPRFADPVPYWATANKDEPQKKKEAGE